MMLAYVGARRDWWLYGQNDFPAFYAGAHLLGTGELYDADALHDVETRFLGDYAKTHGYVRPPFHAALLWPLTRLDYLTAFYIWETILLACFAFFVWKWPLPGFTARLPFCLMAIPVFECFVIGQDPPLLLAALAGSTALHRRGRPLLAGGLFSLCAIKPHLFLLAPIWVLVRKDWPFLKGVLAGGGALAAVSFAVAGWDWPARLIASAGNPAFSPNPHLMPNLTALLLDVPAADAWYAVAALALGGACWYVAREEPFEVGLAPVLLGGVLLGRHSYLADCALWLPATLTLLCAARLPALRLGAVALMVPLTYFLGGAARPAAPAAALALLLIAAMAYERWRLGVRPPATAAPAATRAQVNRPLGGAQLPAQ